MCCDYITYSETGVKNDSMIDNTKTSLTKLCIRTEIEIRSLSEQILVTPLLDI